MVRHPDKYQSREIRKAIRELLMADWDPIGLRGLPGSERVYDVFVGSVYLVLVQEEVSAGQIEAHLLDAATGRLGLPRTAGIEEASARAAGKLMQLRPQLQLH
jgi:hypothetical protein